MRDKKYDQFKSYLKIKRKRSSALGMILIVFSLVSLVFEVTSSFVYFYKNYLLYSFIGTGVMLVYLWYYLPRRYTDSEILRNDLYYIGTIASIGLLSLWYVPKLMHYTTLDSKTVCINAHMHYKNYIHYNQAGIVSFVIDPTGISQDELLKQKTLNGISKYEYDQLPPTGSKIQICGELSKVGFSYAYIDTVP